MERQRPDIWQVIFVRRGIVFDTKCFYTKAAALRCKNYFENQADRENDDVTLFKLSISGKRPVLSRCVLADSKTVPVKVILVDAN